jgi:hypothetical protein
MSISTYFRPNIHQNGLEILGVNNGFNSGFNSDFKVYSLCNTGHNKWKALLPTKLQFKDDKNPTWLRILDVVGCSFPLLRRVYWPVLQECYAITNWKLVKFYLSCR